MAVPAVPTIISPRDDVTSTSLPLLTATVPALSGQVVYAVLMTAGGQILSVNAMTNTTGTTWTYQPVAPTSTNQITSFTLSAVPASGTLQFRLFDVLTVSVPWDADADGIREAIEASPDVGPGNVTVIGSLAGTYVEVQFVGDMSGLDIPPSGVASQIFVHSNVTKTLKDAGGTDVTVTAADLSAAVGDVPLVEGQYNGRYAWAAIAREGSGTLNYSGGTPNFRYAELSEMATFWVSNTLGLTVETPTAGQVIDDLRPIFYWTVTNALEDVDPVDYQEVYYFHTGTGVGLYLWATDGSNPNARDVPLRDTRGRETDRRAHPARLIFTNGGTYSATFFVRKASGQSATVTRTFTISYTGAVAPSTFNATLSSDKTYLDLDHTAAANNALWRAYVYSVRDVGTALRDKSERIVGRVTDRLDTNFRTFAFPFNRPFIVAVEVETEVDGKLYYGTAAQATFASGVPFSGTVISEVFSPETHVILPARQNRRKRHPKETFTRTPWGGREPVSQRSRAYGTEIECTYPIWELGNYEAQRTTISKLRKFDENVSLETYLYRDSVDHEIYYGELDDLDENESVEFGVTHVSFTFRALERTELERIEGAL